MTTRHRIGLVDMGSNAIRTQIVEVEDGEQHTLESERVPVRLGGDVFATGSLRADTLQRTVEAYVRFREQCDALAVDSIAAIATSATRNADNGDELVERIRNATGIDVRVISGATEAHYLWYAVDAKLDTSQGRLLLADLGGGSTELVEVEAGEIIAAESFACGAVRLLQMLPTGADELTGEDLLDAIEAAFAPIEATMHDSFERPIDHCIAIGGNIEALTELIALDHTLEVELGQLSCSVEQLDIWTARLAALTQSERAARFSLRPDRADSIVPAGVVYSAIARLGGAETLVVPRVSVRDGLRAATLRELTDDPGT